MRETNTTTEITEKIQGESVVKGKRQILRLG